MHCPLGLNPHWEDTHYPLEKGAARHAQNAWRKLLWAHGVYALVQTLWQLFGAGWGWYRRCCGAAIVIVNASYVLQACRRRHRVRVISFSVHCQRNMYHNNKVPCTLIC